MSLLFGSGKKQKPQYSSLQVQSSSNNVAVPLGWGLTRVAPNLIGWWDFQSHKAKQGGKGGGGKGGGQYTYTAAVAMALVIGVSGGVNKVYVDNDKNSTLSKLNLTFFSGTDPQTPWSYLTSNHPADALSYPSLVYVASPKYDLGSSASLPQHSFELKMRLYNSAPGGNGDADVALVIQDYLTMPIYGCLFPTASLDTGTLLSTVDAGTTGDASAQTYCTAMGFGFSPILSSQEEALTTLKRWCDTFNIAPVYNGDVLKFIPFALEPVSGNGVNYVPVSTSIYSLTDADFITSNDPNSEGDDPVLVSRKDPAKVKNRLQIEISSRAKEYNAVPFEWIDQGLIDQHGDLPDSVFTAHEVTEPSIATVCVSLMGQRNAFRGNNEYKLLLSPALILAEPMDLLTINDPQMGVIQVQVDTVSEDDDFNLTFECSQVMFGSSASTGFNVPDQNVTGNDTGVDPGSINTPIIFQPPGAVTSPPGKAQIWAAVSGGAAGVSNPNWGGCHVWVSTDNTTYTQIGEITAPARMGKTTTLLPTYGGANPDTGHTVGIDLTESAGSMLSVSSGDAQRGASMCYIGGEIVGPRDATLTSAYHYTLGGELWRGLFGSTIGAHAIGSDFARLDDAIFEYDLPPEYVGVPLWFKFQSYNIFGQAVQDISTCTAYTFTATAPTGTFTVDTTTNPPTDGSGLVYDGTTGQWVPADTTFRMYGSVDGKPDAGQELFDIEMNGDEVFAAGFPKNLGSCDVAPTADATFLIKKNGATVGNMKILAGTTVAVWTLAAGLTFAQGDRLSFYAPAVQDGTLSGPRYTFIGKRT